MAEKNGTNRYNIDGLALNSISSGDNTKNIVHIVNAVFHPDYFDTFLTLNDRKARKDFEKGNGAKNLQFWSIIADFVNGANNIELDDFFVINENDDYNQYVLKAERSGYLPIGSSQQTGLTCNAIINSVVKICSIILANMTKRGQHDHDPFLYQVHYCGCDAPEFSSIG